MIHTPINTFLDWKETTSSWYGTGMSEDGNPVEYFVESAAEGGPYIFGLVESDNGGEGEEASLREAKEACEHHYSTGYWSIHESA